MVSVISLMGLFQQKSAWYVGRAADQEDQCAVILGMPLSYGPVWPRVRHADPGCKYNWKCWCKVY